MPPKVTVITCSYNKPQYVLDAINSVLDQTFKDFEYIILENSNDNKTRDIVYSIKDPRVKIISVDFSENERKRIYIESHLKNIYSKEAKGKYLLYLADDDILDINCLKEHIDAFEKDIKQRANYHSYRITYETDRPDDVIIAKKVFSVKRKSTNRVDGGTVMFEKALLDEVGEVLFKRNWKDAHISDALFVNKISGITDIVPIPKILHIKRVTNISTHTFVDKEGVVMFYRPKKNE